MIKATIKRFVEYCQAQGISLRPENFSIRYQTGIPRQVGLAGSSAIITATLRALLESSLGHRDELAPAWLGHDLEVMERDARRMRGDRPFVFTNLKENKGVAEIAEFVLRQGGIAA